MSPLEIQFELKKKDITQKVLAEELGVSQMAISQVIHRRSVSKKIMKKIGHAIDKDYRLVFPDYFLKPRASRRSGKVF